MSIERSLSSRPGYFNNNNNNKKKKSKTRNFKTKTKQSSKLRPCNRPYAYDVTEGRPRVLGVKRGSATCAIAKHAASGPTPACHTAGLARARALTERLSAMRSASTTRARSATSLDPQHGVVVMET